jgi:hypothetical protein
MTKKNVSKVGMKYKRNRGEIVKEKCANFDAGTSHCLLTDKACPLVPFSYRGHKFPTDEAECSYFEKYLLGIREEVSEDEAEAPDKVTGKVGTSKKVIYSYRECALCGNTFNPTNSRNKYCSKGCTCLARKMTNNRYYTNKD